jgi:hypothetical protein
LLEKYGPEFAAPATARAARAARTREFGASQVSDK